MAKKKAVKKNASKKKLHPPIHEIHGFWEKVEHYNAKLITPALVVLLFVIVVELVPRFQDFAHHYHSYILILDYFVIGVFVIDLTFLAIKAKSVKFFFKSYWLDILAIFPLALAFSFLTKIFRLVFVSSQVAIGQAIVHETLEARKGVQAATRSGKATKFVKLGARSIRIVTKSRLFSQFDSKHHLAKRKWKTHRRKGKKPNIKKRK